MSDPLRLPRRIRLAFRVLFSPADTDEYGVRLIRARLRRKLRAFLGLKP